MYKVLLIWFCNILRLILHRLEEALDGSKETSAKDIKECLQIIQEMRNHYELQMTKQWYYSTLKIHLRSYLFYSNSGDCVDVLDSTNFSLISVRFNLMSIMSFSILYKWSESFNSFLNPFCFDGILQMNMFLLLQFTSYSLSLWNIAQCSPRNFQK